LSHEALTGPTGGRLGEADTGRHECADQAAALDPGW
jgi:hypothetical protein